MRLGRPLAAYLCLLATSAAPAGARGQPATPVEINFAAEVAGEPFACTKTYVLGQDKVRWQPQDLRLYVTDFKLLRADGSEIPVALVSDGTWQNRDVALLDFEDRSGTCQNGTPQINTKVRGTVADASGAVGLKFTMAVPFAHNHGDASTQDPPLDQAGLFWGWQLGYKFLSLEGRVNNAAAHTVHLGSTGCSMPTPGKVDGCRAMNEVVVTLPRFDGKTQTVVADVAQLLADSTLGQASSPCPKVPPAPAAGTHVPQVLPPHSTSCMAEFDNANCAPIFARLGLPFAGKPAPGAQMFFHVR